MGEVCERHSLVASFEVLDIAVLGERFTSHLLTLEDSSDLAEVHELGAGQRHLQLITLQLLPDQCLVALNVISIGDAAEDKS